MKQLISIILLLFCLAHTHEVKADNIGHSVIQLEKTENEPVEDPIPSKGHRAPAPPAFCVIDLSIPAIETNIPSEILTYEIWDETGESIYDSFHSSHETAVYLTALNGTYQLRLVTQHAAYIGYVYI